MRWVAGKHDVDGYYEMTVQIGHEALEAVTDFLVRHGAGGVAYDEGPVSVVRAYFRPESVGKVQRQLEEHLDRLPEYGLEPGTPQVSVRFVPNADWANAWREYYHVHRVGQRLVIRPVWEEYQAQPGDVVIDMDPGMAFGTGEHATTALCLEALDAVVRKGDRVADIGTGSGILSIAAAKLGASQVDAVDVDPEAVRVAIQNVNANEVQERVRVALGDADCLKQFGREPYDVLVMNIIADVIIASLPKLTAYIDQHTTVLLSGIIDSRREDVARALTDNGLRASEWRSQGEWLLVRAGR